MLKLDTYPSQKKLKEMLHYAPISDPALGLKAGDWIWLVNRPRPDGSILVRAGDNAGYPRPNGGVFVTIDGRRFSAHRLAFIFMTGACPPGIVQHLDGNKHNNAWANLAHAALAILNASPATPSVLSGAAAPSSDLPMGPGVRLKTNRIGSTITASMKIDKLGVGLICRGERTRIIVARDYPTPGLADEAVSEFASGLGAAANELVRLEKRGSKLTIVLECMIANDEKFLELASDVLNELKDGGAISATA